MLNEFLNPWELVALLELSSGVNLIFLKLEFFLNIFSFFSVNNLLKRE